jgi:peptidyl-prolyl cis-trans isomerase C
MVEKELFYQEAKKQGLKAPNKWIKEQKEAVAARLGGMSNLEKAFKQRGIREKDYDKWLDRKYVIDELLQKEVDGPSAATDEEARQYYEKYKKNYFRPEARRISHILISVSPSASPEERAAARKKAEDILEKLRKGADFGDLAYNNSDDPYRVKSGDLGIVHKGQMDPDLEAKIFKLKAGQTSGIIETIYGYHIARVEEVLPGEQLPYEQVSEKLKKDLSEKKKAELREALVKRLKSQATIEIFD